MTAIKTPQPKVPKLRFPEFKDEWKYSKIEDLFQFKNGLNKEKEFFGKGTPIINFMDVYRLSSIKKQNIVGLVELEKAEKDRYSAKIGDVFFTRTSETIDDIGMTATLVEEIKDCVFSGFVLRARPYDKSFVPEFTSYLFSIASIRKEIVTKSSMTTRALTSGTLLNKVNFFYPQKLNEQQKIANFLSVIDAKIQALQQKETLLKDYKKGVVQQIFSRTIRFKDTNGASFPDWEKTKLGKLLKQKSIRKGDSDINLILSVSNTKGFIPQSVQFDNHRVASKDVSNYKVVEKYDYAYNPSRINVGSIAVLRDYEQGIVSPMYIIFELKKGLNIEFFDNLITTHLFKHLIKVGCSGSVRDSLNFNDLADFKVEIPCLEEQKLIAQFLTNLDAKIVQINTQKTNTEQFKKALLQQMFV
ncbi:restriction endonuclease subunit S [Corallibacter vietnamensis]|uniref:Restriction endonuclease subunit S n=1 Tax=Corallibacter vietnamensis TaxID=904130 RepID=A0ABP7GXU2_9FLAO